MARFSANTKGLALAGPHSVLAYRYSINPELAVSDSTLTFKLLGHTKRDDGLIGRYHPEVTDSRNGKTATISVEPRHLPRPEA